MEIREGGEEVPVTERSNLLSRNIDVASPWEIVSILRQCDEELFPDQTGSRGLNAEGVVFKIEAIAEKIRNIIKTPSTGLVCMSGCGTSGRLAFIACRTFNDYLKRLGKDPCFHYIIAGGDRALFTSQELAEDDPHMGAKILEQATVGKSKVVYIGISCGFSAPFVAGQLDHCLSNLDTFTPVLIGFNPSHLARDLPITNWHKTFLSVVKQLMECEKSGCGFVLNPMIGPDPITGSSRMKSGSATRILLEVMILSAIHGYNCQCVKDLMLCYRQTCDSVYRQGRQLGTVVQMAGDGLRSKGHIYYVGCDGQAVMAMVDASECPPTFGAAVEDIRGFIDGGYTAMSNNDGDLSTHGREYRISLSDFETDIVPFVDSKDFIIFIGQEVVNKVGKAVWKADCKKVLILFKTDISQEYPWEDFHIVVCIDLDLPILQSVVPETAKVIMTSLLQEMAVKWVLNNISTGAHILKGKVCGNWMIDVRTSNTKLYHRAIGIVQHFSGRSRIEAEENLLRSIYEQEELDEAIKLKSILDHIQTSAHKDMIVPTAILLACQRCSVESAKKQIQKEPIIRKLLCNY